MLSRLRKTTTLGGNVEPCVRKPSPPEPTRARKKSCLVYAKRMFTESSLKISPLVYTRRTLPNASVVSSTRDATFFDKLLSRLRETPTLGGKREAEPSPAQPNPAEPSRSEASRNPNTKQSCVSSTRNAVFFPDVGIWYGGGLEEMPFRLREMILCLQKCCFVYARHPLCGRAGPSRAEPSRAGPSRPERSRAELGAGLSRAEPSRAAPR